MKLIRLLFILALLGGVGYTQRARLKLLLNKSDSGPSIASMDGPAHVTNTLQAAIDLANSEGKTLLYHFSVDNCNPCNLVDEHVFDNAVWRDYARENVKIINVHFPNQFTDKDTALVKNAELMDSVCKTTGLPQGFPIVAVFSSDGHVLDARSGYRGEEARDYISWMEQLRKRDVHRPTKPAVTATAAKTDASTPTKPMTTASAPASTPPPAPKPAATTTTSVTVTTQTFTNLAAKPAVADRAPESFLTIKGLTGGKNPVAMVSTTLKNYDLLQGDVVSMQTPAGKIRVKCTGITGDGVVLQVGEEGATKEIKLARE